MRTISIIIIHCSATPDGKSLSFEDCRTYHMKDRDFKDIGYHYYITRDGKVHKGRPHATIGAHCRGHNSHSIGVCYEGGLNANNEPQDTRTAAQRDSLLKLLKILRKLYPSAIILGHHDLNPIKLCPCFNAANEYSVI